MSSLPSVSRSRCLFVGTSLTTGLWTAVALGAQEVVAGWPAAWRTPEDAVVSLCLGGLVLVAAWAWLQAMAGVADAWRGSRARPGGVVRRLALLACGAALVGAAATAPAHAHPDEPHPLSGLPLPQRAEGDAGAGPPATAAAISGAPADRSVRVVVGDSLWSIAAHQLGEHATAPEVAQRWRGVYAANRAVIGPDPDLIHPGQVLRITEEKP